MLTMTQTPIRTTLLLPAFLALAGPVAGGQAPDTAAYVRRGRQVEVIQRELTARVNALHDTLAVVLRRWAPDLLPRLEPAPPIATGYQLLPRVVKDAPRQANTTELQPLSY